MRKYMEFAREVGIPEGKLTEEFMFTLKMVDYFYYNKNIGSQDVRDCFVDGANDGGIDYIYSDGERMYLIQGKSSEKISIDIISSALHKMVRTINKFEKKEYESFNENLKTVFINAYDDLDESKNITLVLFTADKLSPTIRNAIKEMENEQAFLRFEIQVYDAVDFNDQEYILEQNEQYVDYYKLKLDKAQELTYGKNGAIFNIKASSLKDLYNIYGKKGLFGFNLREHIRDKKVDTGIDRTIYKEKENFWFYNNGITIGCHNFSRDGNILNLEKFSIINGAQTTTKIGKSTNINEKDDFVLTCKVVKADYDNLGNQGERFIEKISEASNSQKPIKSRDLKANYREQKELQKKAENNEPYDLAISIKRGVNPKNYNKHSIKSDPKRRVTNELIGQLILALLYQTPGLARNAKSKLFDSETIYQQVYMKGHDYNVLFAMVELFDQYEQFRKKYPKVDSNYTDEEILELRTTASNGRFVVLAIIFYFYKELMNIVDGPEDNKIFQNNIKNTKLILEYKKEDHEGKYEENLSYLFGTIVEELNSLYNSKRVSEKITSHSNFFKSDDYYKKIILPHFSRLLNRPPGYFKNWMTVLFKDIKRKEENKE